MFKYHDMLKSADAEPLVQVLISLYRGRFLYWSRPFLLGNRMSLQFCIDGNLVLIDDSSLFAWQKHDWHLASCGRVMVAWTGKKVESLHRFLLDPPSDMHVDHINGNSLDNRLSNLRICTHAENMRNRKMHKNNKCGMKGIYLDHSPGCANKYRAQIRVDGKKINLGRFSSKEDAYSAYKLAARKYHGEFARI